MLERKREKKKREVKQKYLNGSFPKFIWTSAFLNAIAGKKTEPSNLSGRLKAIPNDVPSTE